MLRPASLYLPMPERIGSASIWSIGPHLAAIFAAAPASAAWPASNRTLYVPFWIPQTVMARRLWCLNGTTASTNTITMGLYAADQNGLPTARLVTASATASGASAVQFFDITDTMLHQGCLYYVAMAMNGTTAHNLRWSEAVRTMVPVFQDTSNLPDPAVPATPASAYWPNVGIDLRTAP